jgi:hypothetical protein
MESSKQKLSGGDDKTSVDGGDSYSTYEIGTDLSLSPYKDTGLVAYWRMDEGTGSTTKDNAASNTGTITGATWQTDSNCKRGNCLYFDGSSYVTTPSFALTGTVLTVSGWVKMGTGVSAQTILMDNQGQSAANGYIWFYRPASPPEGLLWKYSDGSAYIDVNMSTFFAGHDNAWVHFVIVCDYFGKTIKWYRDGELIQTDVMSGTPIFPSISEARYLGGKDIAWRTTNGNLDEMRIYNRGLSDAEIKELYEGTK